MEVNGVKFGCICLTGVNWKQLSIRHMRALKFTASVLFFICRCDKSWKIFDFPLFSSYYTMHGTIFIFHFITTSILTVVLAIYFSRRLRSCHTEIIFILQNNKYFVCFFNIFQLCTVFEMLINRNEKF